LLAAVAVAFQIGFELLKRFIGEFAVLFDLRYRVKLPFPLPIPPLPAPAAPDGA
jgi:hypothetical protein